MERRYGLGLRAQILIALSGAFVVSFTALALVVMQVARKVQELEREQRTQALAEVTAVGLDAAAGPSHADLSRFVGRADVKGISVGALGMTPMRFGETRGKASATASLANGDVVSLWVEPLDPDATGPLAALLRLYLFVTGSIILLFIYVALTRLIVRPVEDVTRASERLAAGNLQTSVPIAGAAEVASLAVSFNRMAKELREERIELESRLRELERATNELHSAQDQLIRSEKLASVGRLAAGVAHEIGNPLAAILGLVELLQMGGLSSAEQAEFLTRVRGETERIHRIIRDLLDFSRPVAESSDARARLDEVVEDAVKLVSPQKDLRGVTIERRFEEGVPEVRGAAHELSQVVLNLLLNAADAVAGDGTILIEVTRDDDTVRLRVSDSGHGIPRELEDKLFEPFVTTKPAGKGTGLGLAVSQALIERLGGSISAHNVPRGGACFEVRLKAAP